MKQFVVLSPNQIIQSVDMADRKTQFTDYQSVTTSQQQSLKQVRKIPQNLIIPSTKSRVQQVLSTQDTGMRQMYDAYSPLDISVQ